MRHHVAERKLGMKTAHRRAVLTNLASALILHDRIETTLPRAKELRSIADRIVTLGKKGTVHAMRRARTILRNRQAVQKVFGELARRFADRHGGYTRILKLGYRHGDSAPMAMIEYLASPYKIAEKEGAEKAKAKPKKGEKVKKAASTLREKIFKRSAEKTRVAAEKHLEKKAAPRKVPQQRAKKEA
jgi:large subunit ribosomal protein L17